LLTKECVKDVESISDRRKDVESEAALKRAMIFEFFINYFRLDKESKTGCGQTRFDVKGAGDIESFW